MVGTINQSRYLYTEIKKLNAHPSQVPVMRINGVTICESFACCTYLSLSAEYSKRGSALIPDENSSSGASGFRRHANVLQRAFEVINLEKATQQVAHFSQFWDPQAIVDAVELKQRVEHLMFELKRWEDYLV